MLRELVAIYAQHATESPPHAISNALLSICMFVCHRMALCLSVCPCSLINTIICCSGIK